jgi:flagellar protein FlaF
MYHQRYTEAAEDSSIHARRRERQLLEQAIKKLAIAKVRGFQSPESFEAMEFSRGLWTAFVVDLSNDENALPQSLRASLISIGLWIRREADMIDAGQSKNIDALIEINQMIADGLI